MNKLCIMDSPCCYWSEPRRRFYITGSDPCLPSLLSTNFAAPKLPLLDMITFCASNFGYELLACWSPIKHVCLIRVLKFPHHLELEYWSSIIWSRGRLEENYQPVDYRGGQRLINRSDHRAHGSSERARGLITGSDDHREHRKHCGQRIDDSHASTGKL